SNYRDAPIIGLNQYGSLLDHHRSLVSIDLSAYPPEPAPSRLSASATIFNKITRSCHHLQVLSIQPHIATIEAFEEGEWVCKNPRTLRVRVEGLKDEDKISVCLSELKAVRNMIEWRSSGGFVIEGETIGHRVNKQLLKLARLQMISLETNGYYLAIK
ncbi:hypothetical protein BGX23_004876, partial [Mortierella sp. AD031]